MSHTPTVPLSETAHKILDRADVPDEHKNRLFAIVDHAQALAEDAGLAQKLQGEFGREAVAIILDCNQFVRLHRGGDATGTVEFLLPDAAKDALGATHPLGEPQGMVFKMFGWVSVDPMAGPLEPLLEATAAAFQKAR